eukprot:gene2242-2558_t
MPRYKKEVVTHSKQPQSEWCMQVDHNKFISIGKIVQFLGISTAFLLPAFHAPTGSDTTSYFYRISKKSLFDRAAKQKSWPLLEKLGDEKSLNGDGERDITNFIHRAIYNGKENGGIVTTRINQYDKLRVKTTQSIIPDPGSLKYLIQKANLATYYLKHFSLPVVKKVSVSESGWIREETGHLPRLWYHGPQMPRLVRKSRGKRKTSAKAPAFH